MTFRSLLVIKALVCLVFGVMLLAAPAFLFGLVGASLEPAGRFAAREYGAAMTGTLLLTWLAKGVTAADARRAILLDLLVYDAVGVIVTLLVVQSGVLNALGWGIVAVYGFFAVASAFVLMHEEPAMSVERSKALARRFGEAMNSRQLNLLDEIVAGNFVRHCPATPEADVRSLEAFKGFLGQDTAAFPDSVQTPKLIVAEGDLVALWATYEGTQKGPMGPFPATGKRMHVDFAAFLRLEDSKIAEMWVTWDNVAALGQLGHLRPGPAAGV